MEKPLLNILNKRKADRTPIWFMRQAGRYLPEYRDLRSKAPDFISFCLTPELACEATLQPLRRYDLDAVILFADILLLPYALGRSVAFLEGEGPQLEPVRTSDDSQNLSYHADIISPVFETIKQIKNNLPDGKALIGFAGAPWTVACYIIEGQGKSGYGNAIIAAQSDDFFMDFLLEALVNATKDYILAQIDAGAEVIQLFDSHAGLITGAAYARCVLEPTRRLVSFIKEKHPTVPVIGFPRGSDSGQYQEYASETGVDALSIDQNMDLDFALQQLNGKIIQGNLAPELLKTGGAAMENKTRDIAEKIRKKHIFNLGHGVMQETPPEHISRVIEIIRAVDRGF